MNIVVLTPVGRQLSTDHQRCIDALREWPSISVIREYGITCVDQARSILLERALETKADILFWIDDDIVFDPREVEKVAQHCIDGIYDVLGVAYARRTPGGGMNVRFARSGKIQFFKPGFEEVISVGLGFTAMRRSSIERLIILTPRAKLGIIRNGKPDTIDVSPLFATRVIDGNWLPDDDSFCALARAVELRIGIDLEPRIWHQGQYLYGLEDAASIIERAGTLVVEFTNI
jgi:hypothetical protein